MSKAITLALRTEDAEPILKTYAEMAAKYGSLCDYITRNVDESPGKHVYRRGPTALAEDKKEWQATFLRAKRIVESFGVEYEPVSEQETLDVHYPYWLGEKVSVVDMGPPLGKVRMRKGGEPDWTRPRIKYRGTSGVHSEACRAAATRVVRRWRALLDQAHAA